MLYLLSRGSVQPYSNILHEEKKSLFQGKYFYTELIVGKEMFVGLKTKTKHKLLPKGVEVSPRTFWIYIFIDLLIPQNPAGFLTLNIVHLTSF